MHSMQPQASGLSQRDRGADGSAQLRSSHGHEGQDLQVRCKTDIQIPLEKLFAAAMAYCEAPNPSHRRAPLAPPTWSPKAFAEDLDANCGCKLECFVPSPELHDPAATASEPGPSAAVPEQEAVMATRETSRRSARLVLLALLAAVLAAVGVDAFLERGPHAGRRNAILEGAAEASEPPQAMACQASQEAAPAATAKREWITVPVSPGVPTPADRINGISWAQRGTDTVVTIRANGLIGADAVSLHQVEEEYSQYRMAVGTAAVSQIRIGHHPELTPSCLYVVLDLAEDGIAASQLELGGELIKVTVRPS
jgi:hypothetical protein